MRIPRSYYLPVLTFVVLLFRPMVGHAQSPICAPVSNNPLVMSNLCSAAPPPENATAQAKDSLTPSPLTLTVQQINALTFQNAPLIEELDAILMEANRGDFDLEIHLSNGALFSQALTHRPRLRGGEVEGSSWTIQELSIDELSE